MIINLGKRDRENRDADFMLTEMELGVETSGRKNVELRT